MPHPLTLDNQVTRVVKKFGGVNNLVRALESLNDPEATRTRQQIYKWARPRSQRQGATERPYGMGGVIPTFILPYILKAARLHGILITPEDLYGAELGTPNWRPTKRRKMNGGLK